jgi:uncharacterized glyoxalase superfamily metalloenzyme YdcJ
MARMGTRQANDRVEQWQLRAAFARSLSAMYGAEVPAYLTLQQVCAEINDEALARDGDTAERLGSIERITAERHGAIRVGTEQELRDVATIFGALGMSPVGFYDLRDVSASAVPVVSTAFRPTDATELARNPFRVFTSVLTTDDRRFFDAELQRDLEAFLASRQLFRPELLELAREAERAQSLSAADAAQFIALATAAFELSTEPVDEAWHARLTAVSAVAADIGGMRGTHINHLTPRVLDIDELYARMQARGIAMIDAIQGPPRTDGPAVLLRQTSFRALPETRTMRTADGELVQRVARVRFGEVEARGLALTPAGRLRYDEAMADIAAQPELSATEVWDKRMPMAEASYARAGLAYFRYQLADAQPAGQPPTTVAGLLDGGWVTAAPIVYEDFLPRSAAAIFQSNLTDAGSKNSTHDTVHRDVDWLAGVLDRAVAEPAELYAAQQQASLDEIEQALGRPVGTR